MSRYHEKTVTSLFVRNVHRDCRPEDLRKLFSKYGDISDVYIPQDYYTHEPRGFAYIQFDYREDAEDAVYYLDGCSLFGRALAVCVAQSDRKSPGAMRRGPRWGSGGPIRRQRSYSRSRSPPRRRPRSPSRSRSRSPRRSLPSSSRRRSLSPRRSPSPLPKRVSSSVSRSRSP